MNPWRSFVCEGILFDLDGTLLDSIPTFYNNIRKEFMNFGKEISDELHEQIFLHSLNDDLKKPPGRFFYPKILYKTARRGSLSRQDSLVFVQKVLQQIKKKHKHSLFFPDVNNTLKFLFSRHVKLAIVSNSRTVDIIDLLDHNHLAFYFKAIIGRDQVKKQKPYPDSYLLAAKKLRVSPTNCIVIGDLPLDILAGKRAKMKTVGILTGMSKLEYFPKFAPDLILKDLSMLVKWYKYQYMLRA